MDSVLFVWYIVPAVVLFLGLGLMVTHRAPTVGGILVALTGLYWIYVFAVLWRIH